MSSDQLATYIIDTPIHTKVSDIRKKRDTMSKEKLVERIQAVTTELVKLQYTMREYSVLDWYDKLGDRQKVLHDYFEHHVEEFKKMAQPKHYNWIVLSDREIEPYKHIKDIQKYNDFWIGFVSNIKHVEKATKEYSELRLNGMMFTPLFSDSK